MGSSPVEIHFSSKLKNCFVNISPFLEKEWRNVWHSDCVVKAIHLQFNNKSFYTSWSGNCCKNLEKSHEIEIGRIFAERLGLYDTQQVIATPLPNVSSCQYVTLTPLTRSDCEIARLNSDHIESVLLRQLRVIWEEAIIPVWVQKNNYFFAKLGEIHPSSTCSQLEEFTEVKIVALENYSEANENTSDKERLDTVLTTTTAVSTSDSSITPTEIVSSTHNSGDISVSSVGVVSSDPPVTTCSDKEADTSFTTVVSSTNKDTPVISNIIKRPNTVSFGRSLHQAGDKHELSYSPIDPYPGLRIGVVNFVKSVVLGPHSAEEMKGSEEKSFSSNYAATNKFQLTGLKQNEPPKVNRQQLTQSLPNSKLPITAYYRVQSLVQSRDVTTRRKLRSQSLPLTLLEQSSTVFMYCADLLCAINSLAGHKQNKFSKNFVEIMVCLQKVFTLKERVDMNSSGSKKSDISNDSTPNDDFKESDPGKSFERRYLESSSKQRNISGEKGNSEPTAIVRLVLTTQKNLYSDDKKLFEEELLPGHIAISGSLRRQLKLGVKSSVFVKSISYQPSILLGIVLNPFGEHAYKIKSYRKNEITTAFSSWVKRTTKESPLILSSRMLVEFHITPDIKCEFLLTGIGSDSPNSSITKKQQYFCICEATLSSIAISVGDVIHSSYYLLLSPYPLKNTQILDEEFNRCPISSLGGFYDIYKTCLDFLLHGLSCQPVSQQLRHCKPCGNTLLIYGSGCMAGGSGKSSLAFALCNQLSKHPFLAYVKNIDCLSLRGKRVETIRKLWQKMFSNAAWYDGAVLLFDDLDQLISAPSLIQEHGPEANYTLRLAQVFKDFLAKEVRCSSKIVVIATVNSRDSVHPSLLTTHGNHVFGKSVEIPLPDLEQRFLMLNAILRRKQMSLPSHDIDIRTVAVKTEGCSAKDLNTLVSRSCQVATLRSSDLKQAISLQDFTKALENFKPASLHGIKLHQGNDLTWNDVGGLHEIKQILKETLEWPVKFPDLYNNAPIRLPSGILLYGFPGSGKTMLAGVVASQCSLNFISIKGPELLSKYIGASEQAVRDLFHRAESAKPCILFFDEFDSMAPRRGHDNTGVTDRVVNQLLTQLDGVEGLDGVYILAASSRPDLIDPALLRPGRLDKSVFCGMPNESERLEILKALSSKLKLQTDINFETIAGQTEDFSGADLKSLLSNAQLKRIHTTRSTMAAGNNSGESSRKSDMFFMPQLQHGPRQLDADEHTKIGKQVAVLEDNFYNTVYGKANNSPKPGLCDSVAITQDDIMKALANTAPSVSSEERRKYSSIYQSFQAKKSHSERRIPIVQRATLA